MIKLGDCRELLSEIEDDTFHSCVTDPPYEIKLLGNAWDASGVAFSVKTWREVYRVLKPGAYLVGFASPRTYHRMVIAMERAGFVVRDQIAWLKGGAAMPKGGHLDVAIDKSLKRTRKVVGSRTLSGSAALSIKEKGGTYGVGQDSRGKKVEVPVTEPASDEAKAWQGWAYNLAPRLEPIVLAQKPCDGPTVRSVLRHGTGALNTGGAAIRGDNGATRWPPNGVILHSEGCSKEECEPFCPARILSEQSGETRSAGNKRPTSGTGAFFGSTTGRRAFDLQTVAKGDSGSCERYFQRFYWHGKSSKREKSVNGQLEVPESMASIKPVELVKWLVHLVTPGDGWCLDPFEGSGTTQIACDALGVRHFGCEKSKVHYRFAKRRVKLMKEKL